MKTRIGPEKLDPVRPTFEVSAPLVSEIEWPTLVWLALLVAIGLATFECLIPFLFPHLTSWQFQAMTICAGIVAAVSSSYFIARKLGWAVAKHTRAENELALDRNVLRTVTDNIPDSIFAKDVEGRYLLVNKAFATIHGVNSVNDLLGKSAFDLFPEEQAAALHANDLQVMRTRGASMESERTTVDAEGNVKWLQTTKVPLIDKNEMVVGIVGVHRDITLRKEAELRLRQSEANLVAAQRIAHFGSVELDLISLNEPEKNPLRWSDEVFRIYGYEPSGVEVSWRTFFRLMRPEDRDRVRATLDEAISQAKPYTIEFKIIRPDGTERIIHEQGDIITNPKTQKPVKLVGSIQDVTERIFAEVQLHKANRELADRVLELQLRSKEIAVLSEMGSRLQACQTADEAYVEVGTATEQLFPEWSGTLCVISASRKAVETVATWGKTSNVEHVFTPDDCWALRRGQPQWFTRSKKVTPCRHTDPTKVNESLCVPLMAQGEALGIVSLQMIRTPESQEPAIRPSEEAERRLATVLAEQVGLALGNLRLRETLRNQSIRDPLTGLFNRRYMEESLEREFSRASRNKTCVAIIMMDIDHFKRFNDTFGHEAGDLLLRGLGDFLNRSTRGQDIACRFGGEEFALVLSDSTLSGALQRAESLRQEVKHLNVQYAGQLLGAISISMGLALCPDHGSTISEVLRAADQALYCAKREGRDRVSVWTAESVLLATGTHSRSLPADN